MSYRYPVGKPSIGEEEISYVTNALRNIQLSQGENVKTFEALLAGYLGIRNAVVCSSGTTALHLALVAARIGPGDEVLVPDLTFVATANAVRYVGAKPIFIDIEPDTWNLDFEYAARKITSRTKAIIPVHLYGVPCDMTEMERFSKIYGLIVIEDAAEALGGSWHGKACGTCGDMGVFSFYANKVMTTGEGGAIVTDDDETANSLRFFRGQAQAPDKRFWHEAIGYNYRMTDFQAAMGIIQLSRLDKFLAERRKIVAAYRNHLYSVLDFPHVVGSAPWLFTGVSNVPYRVLEPALKNRDIEVRPMFVPMHRLPMYIELDHDFPESSKICEYGISLPTYPDLTLDDVAYIARQVFEVIDVNNKRRLY